MKTQRLWFLVAVLTISDVGFSMGAQTKAYRYTHVSFPLINFGREMAAHVEMNLFGNAGVSFEYIKVNAAEEFSDKEVEEKGVSLKTYGWEASLAVARYSRPQHMAGFYWLLGAGYRSLEVELRKQRESDYVLATDERLEEEGWVAYDMTASGVTGRGRLGYRYIGQSVPFIVGGFFGIRHFASKFNDKNKDTKPEDSPVTVDEKDSFSRMAMTKMVLGLEVGMTL